MIHEWLMYKQLTILIVIKDILNILPCINRYRTCAILMLCVIVGLISCKSYETEQSKELSSTVQLKMYTAPASSSTATANENYMQQLKALVYVSDGNNYLFSYFGDIENISHPNNEYTNFSISLLSEARPVKIVLIINADGAVIAANPMVGQTELDIKKRLNKEFTVAGITTYLPMWAEFSFPDGVSTSTENTLYGATALRAVARADINASLVSSVFEMTSIQIYRANSLIQLIPNDFRTNPMRVDVPSVPDPFTPVINTEPILVTQNVSTSQLYLPESLAPDRNNQIIAATCIVVGGKYNGSETTTYYRLDFNPPITDYPLGQILRNNQYTFNITSVKGPGWSTPDDAANNVSSHLFTSVLDWTDKFVNVNIDGRNYFFLSTNQVVLSGYKFETEYIPVETNILHPTVYWSDVSGDPTDDYNDVSIANEFFTVSINSEQIVVQSLQNNPRGNGNRQQYFTVAADRLRLPIQIKQEESECYDFISVDAVGTVNRSVNINTTAAALEVRPVFAAGGTATVAYQWYSNTASNNTSGTAINGATASMFVPPTTVISTVFYYCVATSECDGQSLPSPIFTFTTQCPSPSPIGLLGSQTPSGTVNSGTNVTMTVTPPTLAAGSQLRYRWFHGNTLIAGQTGTSLVRTITANTTFRCEAFNASCSSTIASRTFTVTIIPPPVLAFNTIEFKLASDPDVDANWTILGTTPRFAGQRTATSMIVRRGQIFDFRSVVVFSSGAPARWRTEIWSTHTGGGSSTRIAGPTVNAQAVGRLTMNMNMSFFQINSAVFNDGTGALIQDGTRWNVTVQD